MPPPRGQPPPRRPGMNYVIHSYSVFHTFVVMIRFVAAVPVFGCVLGLAFVSELRGQFASDLVKEMVGARGAVELERRGSSPWTVEP